MMLPKFVVLDSLLPRLFGLDGIPCCSRVSLVEDAQRSSRLTMRECKPLEVMRVFVSGFISIWGLDRDTPHLMAFTCHIKSARSITAFMEAHKVPSFTKVLTQVDNARSNQCHRRIMPCWAPHELDSVEHGL